MTHLHLHSQYSALDGIGNSSDYAKKAKEMGHKAIALTDHGKLSGIVEHQHACQKEGIKPIFGVEGYTVEELETFNEEGKRVRGKNNHIILLAKNEVGYKNLLKLNYLSFADSSHYYYNNRFTHDELFEHKDGILLGTACIASPFAHTLNTKGEVEAEKVFQKFYSNFKQDMYVELQLNELTNQIGGLERGQLTVNNFMLKMAKKYDLPICLTGDVHYANSGEDLIQTMSMMISQKKTFDDTDNFELEGKSLFYQDAEDFFRFNKEFQYGYNEKDLKEWLDNTDIIASKCDFLLPERKRMEIPSVFDDDDREMIIKSKEGLARKLKVSSYDQVPKEYRDRLEGEIKVLLSKGMASYMMILWDIFRFCEEKDIWRGLGRGSVCGSLVAYALDISRADPLKFGLVFERFMSATRSPDVVYSWLSE